MRLYADLARWWPLLSPPEDYAEECEAVLSIVQQALKAPIQRLLELGSGGGHLACHVPDEIELVLLDRSAEMLAVSRALNPGREHVQADLREARLGARFDAVLLHDAVMYMTTREDLAAALATVAAHLRPGGVALVLPDRIAEVFEEGCVLGGSDAEDGRAARFMEWHFDLDPDDERYEVNFAFMLREADGAVQTVNESHVFGLFDIETWAALIAAAGLERLPVPESGPFEPEVCFLLRRPAGLARPTPSH